MPGGRANAADRPGGANDASGRPSCSGSEWGAGTDVILVAGALLLGFLGGSGRETGSGAFSIAVAFFGSGAGGEGAGGSGSAAGGGGCARLPVLAGLAGGLAAAIGGTVVLLLKSTSSTSSTLMPSGLASRSPIWRSDDDLLAPNKMAACSTAAHATPIQNLRSCARRTAKVRLTTA